METGGNRELPLCRVIVVNRNTRDLLTACLDSLEREQRSTAGIEVVVVDSASTDGSVQAVRERYSWARFVELPENRGYSFAINRGSEGAAARYLLVMNSDVILEAGAIGTLASFLDTNPASAVAGPMITNPDGSMQRSHNRSFPGLSNIWFSACGISSLRERLYRVLRVRRALARLFWRREGPVRVAWVGGACFMVMREVFERIGGMDERFFLYCEDTDLCKRAVGSGASVHFVPGAVVVHHWNSSIGKLPDSGFISSVRSGFLYCEKHTPRLMPLARVLYSLGIVARLLAASCLSLFPRNRSAWRVRKWLSWEALEIVTGTPVRERLKASVKRVVLLQRGVFLALLLHPGRRIDGIRGLGRLRRILILRHDGIGDMVLTLPLLKMLAVGYPGARLSVLASPLNARVASASPHVHEVLVHGGSGIRGILREVRRLRSMRFDLVVDPMVTDRLGTAFFAWLTGARYRCGFASEERERFFNVASPRGDPGTDMLENMERLARSIGAGVQVQEAIALEGLLSRENGGGARARRELAERGMPSGKPVLGIHPGGRYSSQRWPLERFQRVALELNRRGECGVLFFQGGEGTDGAWPYWLPAEGLVVAKWGSLDCFMEQLRTVSLLLCNNSGPLHVARALGIPTISLTGPTRNAFLPHDGGKHIALGVEMPCRPCDKPLCWHHGCLASIEVEDVVRTVLDRLGELQGSGSSEEPCARGERKGDPR
jgi:ADP-heptose:LPS heptosyltransferase/GT2 family glycosyltransferase